MKNIKYIFLFLACISFLKVSQGYAKNDAGVSVHQNQTHKESKCVSAKASNQLLEIDIDEEVDDESQIEVDQLYTLADASLNKIANTPITTNLSHYSTVYFNSTVSLFILLLQILI